MDMSWLAAEAKQIHDLFSSLFYSIVLVMISFGVLMSFFKMPMGQVPEFLHLVGRAVLAAFILTATPEIMNTLANITDDIAKNIGELNNYHLVLSRLGEKIGTLSWSWVSVKDSVLLLISYLSFALVYVSVYIVDSLFLFTWVLLYVFSPLLIAAFTLPATSAATKGFFRALIEVCLWKVTWSVLAALLWSYALSTVNDPKYDVDFLTAIILNLMLAFSVLLTPFIVRTLIKGGLTSVASTMGGTILATAALTPTGLMAPAATARHMAVRKAKENAKGIFKRRENDDQDEKES